MKTNKKGYVSTVEAAKILGKPVKYLANDRQKYQKIPCIKEGRFLLYKKSDIESLRENLEAKSEKKLGTLHPILKEKSLPETVNLSLETKPTAKKESKVIYVEGGYLKDGVITLGSPVPSPEAQPLPSSSVPKATLHLKKVSLPNQGIESFKVAKIPKDNLANAIRPHISALHVANHKLKEEMAYLHHVVEQLRNESKESAARIYKLEQALENMKAENAKGWVIRLCKD